MHKLTARLDRLANQILQRHEGVSYARLLALFAVGSGAASPRELAGWLSQSEPSTSRMVGVLPAAELLEVRTVAGAGHRRQLRLTDRGAALVARSAPLLEDSFGELVAPSGRGLPRA